MQLIVFFIVFPIIWFISILPNFIFYRFSDIAFFFVYHVFGYRKNVVRENLKLALPHKSDEERKKIEIKSYKHMCDMFLEMVRAFSYSEKKLKKHYRFQNFEQMHEMESKGKSIIMMCAHYANWEWFNITSAYTNTKVYAVYKQIQNKYFDKMVKNIRQKYGTNMIEAKDTVSNMINNVRKGEKGIYMFASDQSPQLHKGNHFETFFGVKVPVHTGAEVLSRKLDMNIVFAKVKKIKRGTYDITLSVIAENVKELDEFVATKRYLDKVEEEILEAPEYYLWTHKRWKHKIA